MEPLDIFASAPLGRGDQGPSSRGSEATAVTPSALATGT
jgi:hypothetical protein